MFNVYIIYVLPLFDVIIVKFVILATTCFNRLVLYFNVGFGHSYKYRTLPMSENFLGHY